MSDSLSASVWERTASGSEGMSKRAFASLLTFWTAFGIATSAAGAYISYGWPMSWWLLIGALVLSIAGTLIALRSDNPLVSFIGFMMVTIPFGLMLGPAVALYTTASVFKILLITTGMVVGLGIIGAVYPKSLESWGAWLFGALLVVLLGMIVTAFAGAFGAQIGGAMKLIDWICVALFSAYVIYDLNRAMRIERTHDNAIDCAMAVYLDFINLFIHLLSLGGTKKD